MAAVFCTRCGNAVPASSQTFCTQCGAAIPMSGTRDADNSIQPLPSLWALMKHPKARKRILGAVGKSLAINAALTALVIVPGLLLIGTNPIAGMIWMFLGSFALMAKSYSKPWRLMTLTCMLPAVVAVLSYILQLWFSRDLLPSSIIILGVAGAGLAVGGVRAKTHNLYIENGAIMAQRTIGYLVVWAAAYLIAQLLRVVGASTLMFQGAVMGSAFTTAMLAAASLMILVKFRRLRLTLR